MQIDFHLGVTYVMSRLAGFDPQNANIIASSAQYVDDAIHEGTIFFNNSSLYNFTSSAHKMLDYRNFKALANHRCWIPFHFIPANQLMEGAAHGTSDFVQRMICRPNSPIAKEVVQATIQSSGKAYSLHLLGVTLHAFVDTWAHQGFAGISHKVNEIKDILDADGNTDVDRKNYRDRYFKKGIHRPFWRKAIEAIASGLISDTNPIGHGSVLSYPDQPYLNWKYIDWRGEVITRDNPKDFCTAAFEMFNVLSAFRKQLGLNTHSLSSEDFKNIETLISETTDMDPMVRLEKWHAAIQSGHFSFGNDTWLYKEIGEGSWLHQSLGFLTHDEFALKEVHYQEHFLSSHWKHLHDALFLHRFHLVHEILPKNKLCVA